MGCRAAARAHAPVATTHATRAAAPHACRCVSTQAEREREEAEKAALRARELERSRCEMKLDRVTKRLTKNLQVGER